MLRSGVPVRMVGLNLTHQALATPEVVQRMRDMHQRRRPPPAEWMGFFGSSYRKGLWEFDAPPVHDPCTIAALIRPELIGWREAFVAVETTGEWTRGTTVVDLFDRYGERQPNALVAMTLDADGYWDLVLGAIDALRDRLMSGAAAGRGVCVVGSINMDTTRHVERLLPGRVRPACPGAGRTSHGGKGANQAVAAAAMGSEVNLKHRRRGARTTRGVRRRWTTSTPGTASTSPVSRSWPGCRPGPR